MIEPLILAAVAVSAAGPWVLQSSDTRVELRVSGDQLWIERLESRETPHNWAGDGIAVPLMPEARVGGEVRPLRWRYSTAVADETAGTVTLTFRNEAPRLLLRSVWRARPGHGPMEHWMELDNASPEVVTVSHQDSLSLAGLAVGVPAEVWWIRRGAGNAQTQGGTYRETVRPGLDLTLPTNPTDGASPVPWLAVQVEQERGLYAGWEFSGVGRVAARSDASGRLSVNVGNTPDFRTDVRPGQRFLVPPAFVGCYAGDVEEGSYRLHRFVLEKLRPPMPEGAPDPILMDALYVDRTTPKANAEYVLQNAHLAHEMGFETFMVDAMWFRQVGDWRWDPQRFPEGHVPLERYLHENGMRFALWCAWTNGGASDDPGALSVRGAYGHPDWFTADVPADWQPGLFWGASLCLASPEARPWCERKTQWLVSAYHLDYLKHDIGPIVTSCARTDHEHTNETDVSYWSALGYYRVMEELRRHRPSVILENCSGAGHIKDFGSVQRSHYIATTDTLSNLPDRQSVYDSTYALPPAILQAYTYNNTYAVEGDDPGPFLWRSAMMSAWQIAPVNSDTWTDEQKLSARRATEIYKSWIRPILHDVKVHHILPRPDGTHWDGMFYWSPSLKRGTVYVFRPASDETANAVVLKGLQADRHYRVWCEDGSTRPGLYSGGTLMAAGLEVRLPERYTSDLVYLQDADLPKPEGLVRPGAFALGHVATTSDAFTASAVLEWQPSQGARSYRVVVARTADLSETVADRTVLATRLVLAGLAPGQLYWRVEAVGWGGKRWSDGEAATLTCPALVPLPGVAFVSDLPWQSASAGSGGHPFRDTNYLGHGLAIGGRPYPKGVWTHSFNDATPADIEVDVGGKGYGTFAADVGLDDASNGGSVQFEVLRDGVVAASSPVLHPREVHALRVPLAGARTVTLRVLNGGDGYSCDHSVWGLARFIAAGREDPLGR